MILVLDQCGKPLAQAKNDFETVKARFDDAAAYLANESDDQANDLIPQEWLSTQDYADLARDAALLPRVRELADRLLADDPPLADRIIDRWVGGASRYASA